MKIGIIGNGFVGKATSEFYCKDIEVNIFDINPDLCKPKNLKLIDMIDCEIIFISVPTPMSNNGSCHLNIVKNVINDLNNIKYNNFIVLRSTVPVGTCEELNCYFMPEFLTEMNYLDDFRNNKEWIFGLKGADNDNIFKEKVFELINLSFNNKKINYNKISFVTTKEAEMIKTFRNSFLATKVSFCNEIYQFCKKKNINYDNFINIACNDERLTHSHTKVPGPEGKFGFGGTCFPKDISSLKYEMNNVGLESIILDSVIHRNNNIDRPNGEWKGDKGRSHID